MIVDDLDIGRSGRAARPFEADTPLQVDTDAMLASAIGLQCFQPIAPECLQLVEAHCCVEDFQSAMACRAKPPATRERYGRRQRPSSCCCPGSSDPKLHTLDVQRHQRWVSPARRARRHRVVHGLKCFRDTYEGGGLSRSCGSGTIISDTSFALWGSPVSCFKRALFQSLRADSAGSMPASLHQAASLPTRCTKR